MTNSVVEELSHLFERNKSSARSAKDVVSIITLVDAIVILPSFIALLFMSVKNLLNLGFPFEILVPSFLLFLPVAIVVSGVLIRKKIGNVNEKGERETSVPVVAFMLFIFTLFSVYIPVMEKVSVLIPSFGSAEIIESLIVLFSVVFTIKSVTNILKE